MSLTTDQPKLQELGDALSRVTERDARRRRTRPIRRAALALVVLAVVGTGTAAAAGLFSPKQIQAAMPAGAVLFSQTEPTCAHQGSNGAFRCTLATTPTEDGPEYLGTKEILVVGGKVAGGCIGLDKAGLTWDCYLGQDAVDHEIITRDFLGEPAGPGRG
jgi:hypothetical protein